MARLQRWIEELRYFAGVKSTFILEGNINDRYPYDNHDFLLIEELINAVFTENVSKESTWHYRTLCVDPVAGFNNENNDRADFLNQDDIDDINRCLTVRGEVPSFSCDRTEKPEGLARRAQMIHSLLTAEITNKAHVVVMPMSSRLCSNVQHKTQQEQNLFTILYDASLKASRIYSLQNTLILLVDKLSDIPAWFHLNNPHVRILSISLPDRLTRLEYIKAELKTELLPAEQERLADLTEGMKLLDLEDLARLFRKPADRHPGISRLEQIVSTYKYGWQEERWSQHRHALMDLPENQGGTLRSRIEKSVKGQPEAVDKVITMLRRAVSGLSGLQHSSRSKPRVVAFLAGPTGVGKTELVKTVARILYHDERSIVRFDMSEYSLEHSDQRLVGSPPGYVGYEAGGELTNAVRRNPQAILLFDEAEKACPSVFNKFLQILEDGRLTDGQGTTVSFADTMIFFTSNVGMKALEEKHPDWNVDHTIVKAFVEAGMEKFPPELRGRIGENNIIVFDLIGNEVARDILKSQLERIEENLAQERDLHIDYSAVIEPLHQIWLNSSDPESGVKFHKYGGRGIGNLVEQYITNPLGDFMFTEDLTAHNKFRAEWRDDQICYVHV